MIHFEGVTFTYPGSTRPALRDVNLEIQSGELALVTGPSGSGKSTLLRCMNGLVPYFSGGQLEGNIRINGLDPLRTPPHILSHHVGFVFQDPEAQFVVDRVEDEIAFALENSAMPRPQMQTRVNQALEYLGLAPLRKRRLETLSGGERQRVAIAAALALQPKVLVLDEPTSQLDPQSAEDVLQTLERLKGELQLTIILAEHRLERVLHFTDQLVYLDQDKPGLIAGPPRQVFPKIPLDPPIIKLGKALGWNPLPLTVAEGRRFATSLLTDQSLDGRILGQDAQAGVQKQQQQAFIEAHALNVAYGDLLALDSVDIAIYPGEIVALIGPNGAGKSTLLRALVGLAHPKGGEVLIAGESSQGKEVAEICQQVGYLPQDPNALLFAETVIDELEITLANHNLKDGRQQTTGLLKQLGLSAYEQAYPRDLSCGERQRVALAAILVTGPGALLLDEPTRGLDYATKHDLVDLLQEFRRRGMAILIVTHDVEFIATVADRVVLLERGKMIFQGTAIEGLTRFERFMPQIVQLFPGKGWLTPQDLLTALKN